MGEVKKGLMKVGLMSRRKGRVSESCEGKRNERGPETSRLPTQYH